MGDGRAIGERRVAALSVVPDLDSFEDGQPRRVARRPGLGVDQFGFQGGEEALRHGVIEALARPAHGRGHAPRGEGGAIAGGGVLAAPVGVMH